MPLTRITVNCIIKDKQLLVNAYHTMMQSVLKIKEHDRLIIIDEKPDGLFAPTNIYGNYAMVEISLFPGRTLETKRELYKEIVNVLGSFGFDPENIRITLYENDRENWGIRGGQAASDL